MTKYTVDDIQIESTPQAIRRKHKLWVGTATSQELHQLVLETINAALDPANSVTNLAITLKHNGAVCLTDNGVGHPIAPRNPHFDSNPLIEQVLMSILVGGYPNRKVFGYLANLGVVLNALGEFLDLEFAQDGKRYSVRCAFGVITQPLQQIGSTSESGTHLCFKPDASIWTEPKLEFERIVQGVRAYEHKIKDATISISDEVTNERVTIAI